MTPWSRATHAQRGKALDDARGQVGDLIDALNLTDPVEAAVVLGLDHLVGLVTETLSYRLGDKPRRDFGAVNDVTLNALAKLKEAAVPVAQEQVDAKLTELGISDRAELPSNSFPLVLYLRRHRIDARYALDARRGRVITVPQVHADTVLALMEVWREDGSDPVKDGLACLRKWGREEAA